jgi:hypothetical protein
MLFTTNSVRTEDLNKTNNFFVQFDNEFEAVNVVEEQEIVETPVSKYISSLVCGQYQKAVEDIENTVIGNRVKRKRNLQQVMQESFFYGSNRFGNNFIA